MKKNRFENIEELKIKQLGAWSIKAGNTLDVTGVSDKFLYVKDVDLKSYLDLYKTEYPCIYLGNGIITQYCDFIKRFDFFPACEYALNEECYILKNSIKSVKMILGVSFLKYTNKYKAIPIEEAKQSTYLMIDGNGYYKIGKSFSPEVRESTLQSENPTIELLAFVGKDIESELHDTYKEKRKRGEWFDLTKNDFKHIVSFYGFTKISA